MTEWLASRVVSLATPMIAPGTHRLFLPPPWNAGGSRRRRLSPSPQSRPPPGQALLIQSALTKHGDRFLSSLATVSGASDSSAVARLIRKFAASSPKSVALNALCNLLSPSTTHPHLASLALPLYRRITDAAWFSYNSKLLADVVALLYQLEQFGDAETLISEAVSKPGICKRDVCLLYCNLIDSHSKRGLNRGFSESFARLQRFASGSCSVYVMRRAYESMIGGLCAMDQPREAEEMMKEMTSAGLKPSVFEFRSVVHSYGRSGMFGHMNEIIARMEQEGMAVDTVCCNMILSSYGSHGDQTQMLFWLRRMKKLGGSGSPLTVRSYNSVLNSIPAMASMLRGPKPFPLSIAELMETLDGDEALLIRELLSSSVLLTVMEWNSAEMRLDLHGAHLCSAYLILLQWMEEARGRFRDGPRAVPAGATVICGAGRHGVVRGKSPVKDLVKEMMARTRSPLRIDRKNTGRFIAKGEAMKLWLCCSPATSDA